MRPKKLNVGLTLIGMIGSVAASAAFAASADAQVPVVVARTGAPAPGSDGHLLVAINSPTSNGRGEVGFTGFVATAGGASTGFVWFDSSIVWINDDAMPIDLDAAEATMGIGSEGEWIYSPFEDGADSVWSNGVRLMRGGDPAPGIPGWYITFCSRPQMNDDGMSSWVSGLSVLPGGSTQGRALYVDFEPVLKSGDVVGGLAIEPQGVGFPYDIAPRVDGRGVHWIARARATVGGVSTQLLIAGDSIVAQGGQPIGDQSVVPGVAYQNFDDCVINGAGHWAAIGDSDGPTSSDGVLLVNGEAIAFEGMVVGGSTLVESPRAVAIDELGRVATIWGTSSDGDQLLLFLPPNAAGLPWSPIPLLRAGDLVDANGDGIAESTVVSLIANPSIAPGLRIGARCVMHVAAAIAIAGQGQQTAIVTVALPAVDEPGDLNLDGVVDGSDLGVLLSTWLDSGIGDLNCDGITDSEDFGLLSAEWSGPTTE